MSSQGESVAAQPETRTCAYCGETAPTRTFEKERRKLGWVCKDGEACVIRNRSRRYRR